jgi:hypothetical protein
VNGVTGVVTANNGKALQLEGSNRWLLPSTLAREQGLALPAVGERVTVELDGAGFVKGIIPAPAAPGGPVSTPRPDATDRAVLRLAALAAAAALLGSGVGQAKAERLVLELERWALDPKGGS